MDGEDNALGAIVQPPESGDEGGELLEGVPHARALSIRMASTGPGEATLLVPYDPRLVGDPDTGVMHGGVVTTLLDTCCGVAVMHSPKGPLSTATLDLRIDYMRPAQPHAPIFAYAHCHRETRSVTFVRAVAYQDSPDDPVATASSVFMVEYRAEGMK